MGGCVGTGVGATGAQIPGSAMHAHSIDEATNSVQHCKHLASGAVAEHTEKSRGR